jgi:OmpA-OmpF porin, OOP family
MKAEFKVRAWVTASAMVATLVLPACTTTSVSSGITKEGQVDGAVVFPDPAKSAWLREGTFPNIDELRKVMPGMSKEQLSLMLGRPHFREGAFGVREWDYIFNFRNTAGGADYSTCQYKVIFDNTAIARNFYWSPAACAGRLTMTKVAAAPVAPAAIDPPPIRIGVPSSPTERIEQAPTAKTAEPRRIQLSADVLFAFARANVNGLPGTRKELERVAAELRAMGRIGRLEIVGHTDRLGSAALNQRLSLARANNVGAYLNAHGVKGVETEVRGQGANAPLVDCKESGLSELIGCLAPNRHVEILAWAVEPAH